MSKLQFGSRTVTPVRDLRNPYAAGTGIDGNQLEQNVIAVNDKVLRNQFMGPAEGAFIDSRAVNYSSTPTHDLVIGKHASNLGEYNTILGNLSGINRSASTSNQNESVIIGYDSAAAGESVAIGAHAAGCRKIGTINIGCRCYTENEGQICIGSNTSAGAGASTDLAGAPGSIVIGYHSKAFRGNDTYPSIIIGNYIDSDEIDTDGSVIIGGIDQNNTEERNHRKTSGRMSVSIGYDSGTTNQYNMGIITIGAYSLAEQTKGIAIGYGANVYGTGDIALGKGAFIAHNNSDSEYSSSIAIGDETKNYGAASITMGFGANTHGSQNISMGNQARTGLDNHNVTGAIAIGHSSSADADYAIQIGPGTNATERTFNVAFMNSGNYRVLNTDGTIPYQRLSPYIPLDGQVLYFDNTTQTMKWKDAGQGGGGGTVTIPVASRTTLGGVKVGNGLNVTTDGTLSVDSSGSGTQWGTITGRLNNQTDLKLALDSKQSVIQFNPMPTPSRSYKGVVAQYIGADSLLYSTGNFYICEENDYPTATCTGDTRWANLEVDAWTFANFIAKYFYSGDLNSVGSKLYQIEYVNQFDGNGWIIYENESCYYVKDIYKMGITAEGAVPELGDCVYVQLNMHDTTEWIWRKLLIDAQVSVNNTLVSTSTKQALSANMGRVLNDKVESLAGISHFLAMWDTDTGIARYLNTGYQYESGDYFIIAETSPKENTLTPTYEGTGSIEDLEVTDITLFETVYTPEDQTVVLTFNNANKWFDYATEQEFNANLAELGLSYTGTPNVDDVITLVYKTNIQYMPAGSQYSGDSPASRIVTNDPVQISDMYFYDGTRWIFLPSSSRQIAVDEDLDDTSRNPVENRVVTEALNDKVNNSDEGNVIFANDENGNNTVLYIGEGLAVEDGELVNTQSGVWGGITGNIENQTDLVQYVASHGGGSGTSYDLADVFTKDRDVRFDTDVNRDVLEYKGDYSDLFFKINSSYDTLKNMKNDLYVTLSRLHNSNGARSKKKMRVMNDGNRFKTDHVYYCWRYLGEGPKGTTSYRYDQENQVWTWVSDQPACQTDFRYFYVSEDCVDAYNLINSDPVIWYNVASSSPYTPYKPNVSQFYGNWGTSFNELQTLGEYVSDLDDDTSLFERCPEYDIDTVISLNSSFSGEQRQSQYNYGNVVKNYFDKMICRVYNVSGIGKVYLWALNDWDYDNDNAIYAYYIDNDGADELVPNEIPKYMSDLQDLGLSVATIIDNPNNYVFVERRSDLNWYRFNGNGGEYSFEDIIDMLRLSTQDFPDQEGDDTTSGWMTNWNSYWMDYPIKPVRLAECKLYMYKQPYAEGDSEVAREYAARMGHAYTFNEIEEDQYLQDIVAHQDEVIFVLPYDTTYIWMRIIGWQKMAYYHNGNDDSNVYAEPNERHNFRHAICKGWNQFIDTFGKSFGQKKFYMSGASNIMFYKLQFNTILGKDLAQNRFSTFKPVNREIFVNGQGTQRLTEQV